MRLTREANRDSLLNEAGILTFLTVAWQGDPHFGAEEANECEFSLSPAPRSRYGLDQRQEEGEG